MIAAMNRLLALPALAVLALLSLTVPVLADDIAGVWWTPDRDGKIAIEIDDTGVISGRLIAVSPEDARSVDANNPDTKLRFRPILGLTILQGFTLNAADGAITGGTIYDPDTGKTYFGSLRMAQDGQLVMRASYAFNMLWRTEILKRVDGPDPAAQQPDEPVLIYLGQDKPDRPSGDPPLSDGAAVPVAEPAALAPAQPADGAAQP
jgi:uncharacterized protein (DUF2147 family)